MKLNENNILLKVLDHKSASFLRAIVIHSNIGLWTSSAAVRSAICHQLDISAPTYFRYVNILVEKSILIPHEVRGLYTINKECYE